MANSVQVLDKIARNMQQRGYTVSRSGNNVVVENGSNDLTVSYVAKSVQSPMGGVDSSVSPFLGIGVGAPGSLKVEGPALSSGSALTVKDLIDTDVAAALMMELGGFGNDVLLFKSNPGAGADLDVRIAGHADVLGVGM